MVEMDQIQRTLSEHGYDYIKIIGQGNFSSVLLCKSKKYGHLFAVKRSIKHRLTQFEYNALISLYHPHIIRLYDSFDDEEAQYHVMEYCTNGTMANKGCLSYDKFIYYAKQILSAISYCHSKKIAHRDIKPENILIDEYDQVKIADFGMAKMFDMELRSSEKCGSLMFLSPEMIQCRNVCPFKADIWALGVTFFYMITGEYPFQSESREELKRLIFLSDFNFDYYEIDPEIRFLISKMTSRNSISRPSADSLLRFSLFEPGNCKKSFSVKDVGGQKVLSTGFYTPITFEEERFCSDSVTTRKRGSLNNVLSYRGIKLYPKIQRVNARLIPAKKSGF